VEKNTRPRGDSRLSPRSFLAGMCLAERARPRAQRVQSKWSVGKNPARWSRRSLLRPGTGALVRLRDSVHGRVRVPLWRSFPPVAERNCVTAR
jgi:hypothetical protein